MKLGLTPAWITAALILVITATFIISSDGTHSGRLLAVAALPFLVACIAGVFGWEARRGRRKWRPLVLLQSAALLLCLASGLCLVRVEALARSMDERSSFSILDMVECELFDEWCIAVAASGLLLLFLVVLDLTIKPESHEPSAEPSAEEADGEPTSQA